MATVEEAPEGSMVEVNPLSRPTVELLTDGPDQRLLRSVERRSFTALIIAEIAAVAAPFVGIGSTVATVAQGTSLAETGFILGIAVPLGVAGGAILESFRLGRKSRRLREKLELPPQKLVLPALIEGGS